MARILYTLAAFGVQISLKKGERGRRVQWIGCTIDVPPPDPSTPDAVALSISPQMVDSILEILQQWDGKGMAPLKDLKSVTGKLSWVAGIVVRLRWVVNVFYSTLAQVTKDQEDGTEERRAAGRDDHRSKVGLFPVKRLGGAGLWIRELFKNPGDRLIRIERMHRPGITRGIITDASPKGWGAVLVAIDKEDDTIWEPLEAVEALITKTEAELLNVEYGEASSQAVMEAYAILRAIDKWGHDWAGRGVMIRSDSTVALAMMQKLGSSHATLNFLAAEISMRLEKFEVQRLVHQHIRGYLNEEADYLSRLAERKDKKKPAGLEGVPLKRASPWEKAERFHLPPPGQKLPPGTLRFTPGEGVFEGLC